MIKRFSFWLITILMAGVLSFNQLDTAKAESPIDNFHSQEMKGLFPLKALITEMVSPYNSSKKVAFLPVYKCPGGCQWLGDLTAGEAVVVSTISTDGLFCFVEGTTIQGWNSAGWVSCARLSIQK